MMHTPPLQAVSSGCAPTSSTSPPAYVKSYSSAGTQGAPMGIPTVTTALSAPPSVRAEPSTSASGPPASAAVPRTDPSVSESEATSRLVHASWNGAPPAAKSRSAVATHVFVIRVLLTHWYPKQGRPSLGAPS